LSNEDLIEKQVTTKIKVLKNSSYYTFSSLLMKALGFLLLPVYTNYLSPEDYGVINLAQGFIQVSIVFVSFSLFSAAIRFYSDYRHDNHTLKLFYSTILNFILVSSLFGFAIGIVFKDLITTLFFKGIPFFPYVLITLQLMIFVSFATMYQSMLQGMQKGLKLALVSTIVFIVTILFKITAIVLFKLGVLGLLLAQLVVNILYVAFIFYDLHKNNLYMWGFDFKLLKEALKYSIPIMPHNLSTRISSIASRILLNNYASIYLVGIYSISIQFGNLIDTIQVAVNRAFQPWFFEVLSSETIIPHKEAVKLSYLLLTFYSFIYLIIGLFSQEAVFLMTNNDYLMAWTVVPIITFGYLIKSIYYIYLNILLYHKREARKLFIATTIGSVADIFIAFLLIPIIDIYGAAIAFVISKLIIVMIVMFISKKYANIGYKISSITKILAPSIIAMAVGLYFSYTNFIYMLDWRNVVYKIFVVAIYTIFVFLTNRRPILTVLSVIKKYLKNKKIYYTSGTSEIS
jgi:O-antigen/teichoic acid export membrane protein